MRKQINLQADIHTYIHTYMFFLPALIHTKMLLSSYRQSHDTHTYIHTYIQYIYAVHPSIHTMPIGLPM